MRNVRFSGAFLAPTPVVDKLTTGIGLSNTPKRSTLGLIAAAVAATAPVALAQPAPLGPTRVEAALRTSGMTVLPDIATRLPPGELMDYGFVGRHGQYLSATVVVYPSTSKALRASIAFQHGRARIGIITKPTQTLRVRNVVLLRGPRVSAAQWRILSLALAQLGTAISP